MCENISQADLEVNFVDYINDVTKNKRKYVIENDGKPVAALVPAEFLLKMKISGDRFLEIIEKARKNTAGLSEEEASGIIDEVIQEVRERRRVNAK